MDNVVLEALDFAYMLTILFCVDGVFFIVVSFLLAMPSLKLVYIRKGEASSAL